MTRPLFPIIFGTIESGLVNGDLATNLRYLSSIVCNHKWHNSRYNVKLYLAIFKLQLASIMPQQPHGPSSIRIRIWTREYKTKYFGPVQHSDRKENSETYLSAKQTWFSRGRFVNDVSIDKISGVVICNCNLLLHQQPSCSAGYTWVILMDRKLYYCMDEG